MAVHDDCKLKFLELKAKRTYRFIVIRLRRSKSRLLLRSLGSQQIVMRISLQASLPVSDTMLCMTLILWQRRMSLGAGLFHCMVFFNVLEFMFLFHSPVLLFVVVLCIYWSIILCMKVPWYFEGEKQNVLCQISG